MSEDRKRLILDLDTGIDDALALAYVLGSPEVELVAVVTSYGNVTAETAARNTLSLLTMLGHPEIPVYLGADRALSVTRPFSPPSGVVRIHGKNGLGNQQPEAWCYTKPKDGLDFLVEALGSQGQPRGARKDEADSGQESRAPRAPVLYVPTGPLTNLATVLVRAPELVRELSQVTFMGGALAVPGNVTALAEANIHNDPEAADVVFGLGVPTRMIGLDVTHQVVLTREDTARWRELNTNAGAFFADMTDHYIHIYEQNNPHLGGCALHDPLAVAAAIDPTLVGCLATNLRVELDGPARGRVVCDPDHLRDDKKNTEVALTVDAPRFLDEFRTRVGRALRQAGEPF